MAPRPPLPLFSLLCLKAHLALHVLACALGISPGHGSLLDPYAVRIRAKGRRDGARRDYGQTPASGQDGAFWDHLPSIPRGPVSPCPGRKSTPSEVDFP